MLLLVLLFFVAAWVFGGLLGVLVAGWLFWKCMIVYGLWIVATSIFGLRRAE